MGPYHLLIHLKNDFLGLCILFKLFQYKAHLLFFILSY